MALSASAALSRAVSFCLRARSFAASLAFASAAFCCAASRLALASARALSRLALISAAFFASAASLAAAARFFRAASAAFLNCALRVLTRVFLSRNFFISLNSASVSAARLSRLSLFFLSVFLSFLGGAFFVSFFGVRFGTGLTGALVAIWGAFGANPLAKLPRLATPSALLRRKLARPAITFFASAGDMAANLSARLASDSTVPLFKLLAVLPSNGAIISISIARFALRCASDILCQSFSHNPGVTLAATFFTFGIISFDSRLVVTLLSSSAACRCAFASC